MKVHAELAPPQRSKALYATLVPQELRRKEIRWFRAVCGEERLQSCGDSRVHAFE
jgi:hypothetical protein